MIERQDFATDKDYEDAYFSDAMVDKQIADKIAWDKENKQDCNSCGHNYNPCTYYPCSECNFYDKYQTKEVVRKLFENMKQNISVSIWGLNSIIDSIKENDNKIKDINIKQLENIVSNLKVLSR